MIKTQAPSILQEGAVPNVVECYLTGSIINLDQHHIYHGPRRKASDEWGCWIWLRHDIHMDLHSWNTELDKRLKMECQVEFEKRYGHEMFMKVFGKSYL